MTQGAGDGIGQDPEEIANKEEISVVVQSGTEGLLGKMIKTYVNEKL